MLGMAPWVKVVRRSCVHSWNDLFKAVMFSLLLIHKSPAGAQGPGRQGSVSPRLYDKKPEEQYDHVVVPFEVTFAEEAV